MFRDRMQACEYDAEWLPRQCPVCEWLAVIGQRNFLEKRSAGSAS
jgi:hypothetical protein